MKRARKKSCIVNLYNTDGDWHCLAAQLNVCQPTAYHWVNEGDKPEVRGGAYNSKITTEPKNAMCEYIENICITLGKLVDKLTNQHQLTVAKSTVFRHMDVAESTLFRHMDAMTYFL